MSADSKVLLEKYKPKQLKTLNLGEQACCVRFSPDGSTLAVGTFEAVVRRWDATADIFRELPLLNGHNGWVQSLEYHPDGSRLFTADSWGSLRCWPTSEASAEPTWAVSNAHDGRIHRIALEPKGGRLATSGADGAVRLWSMADGKKLAEHAFPGEDAFSVAFRPDGRSLVTGHLKGTVRHLNLESGDTVRDFDAARLYLCDRIQDVGGVRCLTFNADGSTLFVAGAEPKSGAFVRATPMVLAFDWATGRLKHTFTHPVETGGFVYDLYTHPDGFLVGVTSGLVGNGSLFFYRPGDEQPFFLAKLQNSHSLGVRPDWKRLVVSSTNGGQRGNGRSKDEEYVGNHSPLIVWDMPAPG